MPFVALTDEKERNRKIISSKKSSVGENGCSFENLIKGFYGVCLVSRQSAYLSFELKVLASFEKAYVNVSRNIFPQKTKCRAQ